jgi:hypothetical protein
MKNLKEYFAILLPVIIALGLSACGNGSSGDGGDTGALPGKPALSLAAQSIKTFHFSWNDVTQETEYQLYEKIEGC